jgi:membrane protein DedA with SNARE-associated domain
MGYITYIAGLGKMNKVKFAMLTFVGFYPLSVLMFYLGTLGNLEVMVDRFQQAQWLIFTLLGLAISMYIGFRFYRRKKYRQENQTSPSQAPTK